MAGFNYGGGKGDGTSWSSERGNEPAPGGDSHGNSGGRDNINNSGNRATGVSDRLVSAGNALARAAGINPESFSLYFIEDGHIIGIANDASVGIDGDFSPAHVNLGPAPADLFSENKTAAGNDNHNAINGGLGLTDLYKGDLSDARINALNKKIADNMTTARLKQSGTRITKARSEIIKAKRELGMINLVRQKNLQAAADEREMLDKAAGLITDTGGRIADYLGEKYRSLAKEIADNIRNFQGKNIRNIDQAMASLNKIISNPGMKINKADKDAIINAWRSLNANDMADKLGNLARAFKAVDVVQKVEKIRQKSIEGFETGNWQPLMLEVESWVLSGLAASFALGILTSIITLVSLVLPVAPVLTIAGIIGLAYLASLIDDKLADKVNNELIRSAY